MSRAPGLRGALWVAILGSALQTGCIHNHYYGTAATIPGCPPTVGSTVTTQVGSLCDVPSGGMVVSNPSSGATVSSGVAAPSKAVPAVGSSDGTSRVVISQPALGPPSIGQSSGRIKWKKPDPEAIPPMKAEGGLDDSISR
jgi:hypothetical protein